MEDSLREESERWLREKERRRRQGEPRGMPPTPVSMDLDLNFGAGSYEQLAEQERRRGHIPEPDEMDMDDYPPRAQPTRRHDIRDVRDVRDLRDPRDIRDLDPPRPVATGRIPVSTGYAPEPGYTAQYPISSQQPGYLPGQSAYYGTDREPRTFNTGNATPPSMATSRAQVGGYGPSGPGYTSRTAPPVSQSIPASYDPRSRDIMGGAYPPGYSDGRARR
jgi:hypothetical protein